MSSFKARNTRERFHVEPYQNRTDRPRVYTVTDGTFPYRTASGTRTGPPRKWVPHGTEPKSSLINSQSLSRQVTLETRHGEIRLRIADDPDNNWIIIFRLELFMRGCFESNGAAQNGSKRSCKREAYPYRNGSTQKCSEVPCKRSLKVTHLE